MYTALLVLEARERCDLGIIRCVNDVGSLFTGRRCDVVEFCVELVKAEFGRLVGVERQHAGWHVHTRTSSDYNEVTVTWSTSQVLLDVIAHVHRRNIGA